MKVGILFSGGKDSSLALHRARRFHEIMCLISLLSKNKESYMFHVPNIELTRVQAEAIGLPLILRTTEGKKEKEIEDLRTALEVAQERYEIEGVVTGAIGSVYQATRIQRVCHELGLWCFDPLWLMDQSELLNELVANHFRVLISGVFAFPLDRTFLGKEIDDEMIRKLGRLMERYKLSPAGEGGEIETTVIDAPFFRKRIEVLDYEISYGSNSGVFVIKDCRLVEK